MKSKKVPVDIKSKTIKEAQSEIKGIIENLENTETNLEDSLARYNRMIQLNHHIQEQFRKKAKDISRTTDLNKNKENLL